MRINLLLLLQQNEKSTQSADALNDIAKSSSFQENQNFINDIQIFKAKDPQSFDE